MQLILKEVKKHADKDYHCGSSAEKKKRVCAYARVSTDSTRQGESLENQTATYERLIRSNPEYAFTGVYAD